jgi:hypothetical protein
MSRAKFEIGDVIPGTPGSLLLLSPASARKLKQLKVPSNLLNAENGAYMIVVFLLPRVKPSQHQYHYKASLSTRLSNDDNSDGLQHLLGDCRGKMFSITNHRRTDTIHSFVLKKFLHKSGAKAESLYKGRPHFLFVQVGTPPDKVPGLAYRRFCYPELRFITFGQSSFTRQENNKEVWPLG